MLQTTSPSRPRAHWRVFVAGLSVAVLLGVGAAPAQANEILVLQITTDDVDIVVTRADASEFIAYRVKATNLSTEVIHLGFGADLREQGTTDYFWLEGGLALGEGFGFSDLGQAVIEPGVTYEEGFLPRWSGMTYSFFSDIDTTPILLGEFVNDGLYLSFDVQYVDGIPDSLQVGYPPTIRPSVARAAESIRIDSEVGTDWPEPNIGVWIQEIPTDASNVVLDSFLLRGLIGGLPGDQISDNLLFVGSLAVSGNRAGGNVTLPADLLPADYVLLLGNDGVGWPGGPILGSLPSSTLSVPANNLTIEPGAPRGSTEPGTAVPVTPLDQFGTTPVSFSFDQVTAGGTTTVTTSTSGPASTAFTLLGGANSVYYELSTTATFNGNVTVCLTYDPAGLTVAQQNAIALFHFTGGAWGNITTARSPGQVCGVTNSFSPFALGIPTLRYAFEGFLSPVSKTQLNQQFAGTIVPIRFRLGGDQGLNVIASGSPTTGVTACTVGATPTASQPAVSAVSPQLTYVRATGTYWYFWKTDKSWAGSCRQFSLTLADGSVHTATFKFTKFTFRSLLGAVLHSAR